MNRKQFISTLLTSVSLPLCGLGGEKPIQTNDNILELKPLPNTKKFGIEVGYYNKNEDVVFMYFAPSRNIAKNWFRSLPLNTDFDLKCEGYFVNPHYLTDDVWQENIVRKVWDDIQIEEKRKIRVNNEIILVRNRFTLHMGFMDNAAHVYNQNDDDKKLFWNRMKNIYIPYPV